MKSDMSEHPTSPTAFSGLFKKESKVEDGWNKWEEGYVPPDPKTLVEVKLRNGTVGEDLAEEWRWCCLGSEYDIVAYRVFTPKPDLEEASEYLRDNDWKENPKSELEDYFDTRIALGKEGEATNKYLRPFPYDTIDIYRVLQVYEVTDPCIQHAVKKLLCAGQRGYKEIEKDVSEAIQSLQRWVAMYEEDKKVEELQQRVLDCYK